MLGLNLGTIIAEIASFLIFLYLMSKYAFPPIEKILRDRQERIQQSIADARHDREEAGKLRQDFEAQLQSARHEAQALIERAQRTADAQSQQIVVSAKQEAERLLSAARDEIEGEKREAIRQIRTEVAELSLDIAGRVLEQELNEKRQRDLVERFLGTEQA